MTTPLSDVLARVDAALAELSRLDLDGLADDTLSDAVLSMQRLRGRVDAAEARVLSRWDAQRCWQPSGAKTGAAWLAWKQRIPIQVARQRACGTRWALRRLPAAEEAWASGDIDRSHLTTLLGARNPRPGAARPPRRTARAAAAATTAGSTTTLAAPTTTPTPTNLGPSADVAAVAPEVQSEISVAKQGPFERAHLPVAVIGSAPRALPGPALADTARGRGHFIEGACLPGWLPWLGRP